MNSDLPSRRGRLLLGPDERRRADVPVMVLTAGRCKQIAAAPAYHSYPI
jgi:hypothetical protein